MARIAVIVGHPRSETYCDALAEAYARGAAAVGHEVAVLGVSQERRQRWLADMEALGRAVR
jgi:NAD(P)H dehydrogenase (quinone)